MKMNCSMYSPEATVWSILQSLHNTGQAHHKGSCLLTLGQESTITNKTLSCQVCILIYALLQWNGVSASLVLAWRLGVFPNLRCSWVYSWCQGWKDTYTGFTWQKFCYEHFLLLTMWPTKFDWKCNLLHSVTILYSLLPKELGECSNS